MKTQYIVIIAHYYKSGFCIFIQVKRTCDSHSAFEDNDSFMLFYTLYIITFENDHIHSNYYKLK